MFHTFFGKLMKNKGKEGEREREREREKNKECDSPMCGYSNYSARAGK